MGETSSVRSDGIFPLGESTPEAFQRYYSGSAFEKVLVPYTSATGVTAAHVTYDKGCRNDWHNHPGGQLILALSGQGWHQEEGKPAVSVHPGDVIEIGAGVKHWHGADKDSCYSYLAIKQIATSGMPEWFGPVTEEEYAVLYSTP